MKAEYVDVSMRQTFSLPLVLQTITLFGAIAAVYANSVATDRELMTKIQGQQTQIEQLQSDNRAYRADLRADLREIKDELRELRSEVTKTGRKQ